MKNTTLLGIVAGAAAASAILYYKRNDVSRMSGNVMHSAKNLGGKLTQYGSQLKDKLLNNMKGPNGEPVYLDMYDRKFYENEMGQRVYLSES